MTHESLLARLREAKGPNRELDEALMALLYTRDERHIGTQEGDDFGGWERVKDSVWVDPKTDKWVSTAAFHFTSSVDAILALIERKLPGLVIKATKIGDRSGFWQIQEAWVEDIEVVSDFHAMDPMPGALAFSIVFVSALSAIAASEGEKP